MAPLHRRLSSGLWVARAALLTFLCACIIPALFTEATTQKQVYTLGVGISVTRSQDGSKQTYTAQSILTATKDTIPTKKGHSPMSSEASQASPSTSSSITAGDEQYVVRVPPQLKQVNVLYYTRHFGTTLDFTYMASKLKLTWSQMSPTQYCPPYGLSAQQADDCWRKVKFVCDLFDVIVVSDTTPDARPFLQNPCKAHIILQITNRFDWDIKDKVQYYSLMNETGKMNTKVYWVANNPLEREHARTANVTFPEERYKLLRPTGWSSLRGVDIPAADHNLAATDVVYYDHVATDMMRKYNARFKELSHGTFGGPRTLAQYAAIVAAPYQASVMSMYESLAVGATYILPSPQLFQYNITYGLRKGSWRDCRCDHIFNRTDWSQLAEWWNKDFKDLFLYFNSWQQLKDMLDDPHLAQRTAPLKRKAIQRMARLRHETLLGYKDIFDEIYQQLAEEQVLAEPLQQQEPSQLWMFRFVYQIAKCDPYTYHDITAILLVLTAMAALAVTAVRAGLNAVRRKHSKL